MKSAKYLVLAAAITMSTVAVAQSQTPAAGAATAPASADDAKAQSVLKNVCTSCHDLGMLTARPHAADEWPTILQQMVGNGANLSDEDFKLLQVYLAKTYSPPAK